MGGEKILIFTTDNFEITFDAKLVLLRHNVRKLKNKTKKIF